MDEAARACAWRSTPSRRSWIAWERRVIQLKIQREMLKKEKDEASRQRLADLENDIDGLEREFSDLNEIWKSEKAALQGATKIKEQVEQAKLELEAAQRRQDFAKMSEIQYGLLPQLEKQLAAAQEAEHKDFKLVQDGSPTRRSPRSCRAGTGIPVNKMLGGERDKLLRMEEVLHNRVVGRRKRSRSSLDAVRRSRAGLSDPNRPAGSFLFLAPDRRRQDRAVQVAGRIPVRQRRRDDPHRHERIHGEAQRRPPDRRPPGYVGYEEGGYLTEAVRRRPYSLILLDEVEKAHPDVFNILLQVLDDGRLTMARAATVDFRNTVIVMTSNLGSHQIQDMSADDSRRPTRR